MRKLLLIVICVLSFLPAVAEEAKNILVVCSFPLSGTWAKNTLGPLLEFDNDKSKMNIHYSVMRNSSFVTVDEYNTQEKTIFDYYGEGRPDFIVIFGPGNYILAEDFNRKWKDIPMMLVGELNYVCDKEYVCDTLPRQDAHRVPMREFAKGKNLTFLHTPVFLDKLADLLCLVSPNVRELYFVGGEEFLSRELELEMGWTAKAFGMKFKAYHPDDITYRDLALLFSNADRKTTSFIYCNWHNKGGHEDPTLPSDGMRYSLEGLVPLFNVYYSTIDKVDKAAGFVSYDHDEFAKTFKHMFLDLAYDLRQAKDVPFVKLSHAAPVLNYDKLTVLGYTPNNLPKGVKVLNLPPTLWDNYKVTLLLTAILCLIALSFLFYVLYRKQKRIRLELDEAKNRAEESEKLKTAFIHTVSHEIRTPLNAVIGFSQLLSLPDYDVSNEEKALYSQYINNNSEMLLMLVNDILNVANIENGQFVMNIETVNCNEVCNKAISIAESRLPGNVKMYFTSEVADDFTIESDGKRIQQVLINYLTNSCKHTDEGEIHLHCSLRENPGMITFSVADTGSGVPVEMAETVFERFSKLDNNKPGVGLGLNICRTIAEKLNGVVKLDTSYTDGARFVFILPLK